MPIQFAREPLTDALWDEAMPLLEAHWREVAAFQDIPLNPDRALYAASEEAGILRVFTAREATNTYRLLAHTVAGVDLVEEQRIPGALVGYALYFVRPAPHYQSSVQAVNDVVYLHPDHRGRTFLRFMTFCDDHLAAEGAQATYLHIKTALPAAHRALEHLGYQVVEKIYAKRLDGAKVERRSGLTGNPNFDGLPEMGDDWRDQAQHDYDTARFVGQKP